MFTERELTEKEVQEMIDRVDEELRHPRDEDHQSQLIERRRMLRALLSTMQEVKP